jgi:DNA-binding response OmpR family regulator
VICAYNSDEANEVLYNQNFDLLLFDVNVPTVSGFELLKDLRDANVTTPAIFITSLSSVEDLEKGFECGADDYIRKPFALKELLIRINSIIKREYKASNDIININENTTFNTKTQIIKIDNIENSINNKETELLKLLIKNENQIVPFETIYETVWSFNENYSETSLRTYIKNLRKILGKDSIKSIKKQGYMFVK